MISLRSITNIEILHSLLKTLFTGLSDQYYIKAKIKNE
jgi:hypothetical protein